MEPHNEFALTCWTHSDMSLLKSVGLRDSAPHMADSYRWHEPGHLRGLGSWWVN